MAWHNPSTPYVLVTHLGLGGLKSVATKTEFKTPKDVFWGETLGVSFAVGKTKVYPKGGRKCPSMSGKQSGLLNSNAKMTTSP